MTIIAHPDDRANAAGGTPPLSNDAALEAVFRRDSAKVFSYACGLLKNADEADDVVQETFLSAREHLTELRDERALLPWLLGIARNACYRRLRRQRLTIPVSDDVLWTETSPLDLTERADRTAIVRKLLNELNPSYREVLILREYEDLSYDEIGALTGLSLSAVKSKLFRARDAMAARLRAYGL